MQSARKGCNPKVNTGRIYKNLWLPKGCYEYNNLLFTAKVRGYCTYNRGDNGDGDSIVLSKQKEVSQLSISENEIVDPNKIHYEGSEDRRSEKNATMNLYHEMFKPQNYKQAYEQIKSKAGNMTPGISGETLDGFSNDKIMKIIEAMKDRSFKFKPSRRIQIPKPNGKLRNIGIPNPIDKIVQRVIKGILERIYEPVFLNTSHGFRPDRSCHTALKYIKTWTGITWTIEGDIKGYFDNIDHKLLAQLLENKIKDKNIIDLYWKMVKAGYINNGEKEIIHSITGVPQGGVISPILSNIYLHEFDIFMEGIKREYTQEGIVSKTRTEYNNIQSLELKAKKTVNKLLKGKVNITTPEDLKDWKESLRQAKTIVKKYTAIKRKTRSKEKILTRVYYVRYADDWIVGVTGTLKVAQEIKTRVSTYLKDKLKLELNEDKTKITHMTRQRAYFLGTEIKTTDRKYTRSLRSTYFRNGKEHTRLPSTGQVKLYAPIHKLINKLKDKGFAKQVKQPGKVSYKISNNFIKKPTKILEGKTKVVPCANTKFIHMTEIQLLERYESILRGYLNWYSFTDNYSRLHRIMYILKYSLICTLARKLRLNTAKVIKKYGKDITIHIPDNNKSRTLKFPKSLKKSNVNSFKNVEFDPLESTKWKIRTISSLDKDCIICGAKDKIEMYHLRSLKNSEPRSYIEQMRAMNRKQIPVCKNCHDKIHKGEYDGIALNKM
jgi:group II intron reverse transcriptase/maturase